MKKRKLSWNDIRKIVEFKTVYIVIVLLLLGILCLFLEYIFFSNNMESVYRGTFTSLGITFITSSTVSIIMEIFMRLDIVDFMSERMLEVMPEEIKGNTGVNAFYFDRKRIDFKEVIKSSDKIIKIIGVSSNDILAAANLPIIKRQLMEHPSLQIQILLLAPWSATAHIRSSAKIYKTKHEAITKTQAVITDIRDLITNLKDDLDISRIQLRVYDDIPSLSMVINCKEAIVAPFMVTEQGGSSPYYIARNVEVHNNVYHLYVEHFDTIWETATPIDENTSMEEIYLKQHIKDDEFVSNAPKHYSKWLLGINNVPEDGDIL